MMETSFLRFMTVTFGRYVLVNRIVAFMDLSCKQARAMLSEAKDRNKWFDMTGGKKATSIILLSDGTIIATAVGASELVRKAETALTNPKYFYAIPADGTSERKANATVRRHRVGDDDYIEHDSDPEPIGNDYVEYIDEFAGVVSTPQAVDEDDDEAPPMVRISSVRPNKTREDVELD